MQFEDTFSKWLGLFLCCCIKLVLWFCFTVERSTAILWHADWMAKLPKQMLDVPLRGIAIPGSHDSASYSINESYALAPDIPPKILYLMNQSKRFKGGELFVRSEIYRWSVTQRLNITQQLELGIRYFDFRIYHKDEDDRFYTYHGLTGAPLETILVQVAAFQKRHPKEVLLLDFNHVYKNFNFTEKSMLKLAQILTGTFGNKICKNRSSEISLTELWKNGKSLIIFIRTSDLDESLNIPDFAFDRSKLSSPFDKPKFYSVKSWLEFLNFEYQHRPRDGSFFVTQGIMQPSLLSIAASSLFKSGSLESWIADDASKSLVKWLPNLRRGTDGINIVMADFVEKHNFTETVLSLNLSTRSGASCQILFNVKFILSLVLFAIILSHQDSLVSLQFLSIVNIVL